MLLGTAVLLDAAMPSVMDTLHKPCSMQTEANSLETLLWAPQLRWTPSAGSVHWFLPFSAHANHQAIKVL